MATGYRHSGKKEAIVSASAAIAAGALVWQEGVLGVAVTAAASGASLTVDTKGNWVVNVPASTVKGDKLYATLSSESVGLTLKRSSVLAGDFLVGVARSDRDSDGKAIVHLAEQPLVALTSADSVELNALAAAIPQAAIVDVATADADGTYGAPEASLINELKTKVNTLLAELRTAGIITP